MDNQPCFVKCDLLYQQPNDCMSPLFFVDLGMPVSADITCESQISGTFTPRSDKRWGLFSIGFLVNLIWNSMNLKSADPIIMFLSQKYICPETTAVIPINSAVMVNGEFC